MVTPSEFVRLWRQDIPLFPFNEQNVRSLGLPVTATDYLINVGMPISDETIPRISNVYPYIPTVQDLYMDRANSEVEDMYKDYPISETSKPLRAFARNIVGHTVGAYYCVSEQEGTVYSVTTGFKKTWQPYFMNSSLPQLYEFMLIIKQDKD